MKKKAPKELLSLFVLWYVFFSVSLFAQETKAENSDKKDKSLLEKAITPINKAATTTFKVAQKIIHAPPMQVTVDEVQLRVSVVNDKNGLVTGLRPDNFEVFDDGVKQKILGFFTDEDPASICIVLDYSGSLGYKLPLSIEAIRKIVKESNPQDEYTLIVFNEKPDVVVGPVSNTQRLEDSLLSIQKAEGKTALLDAIYLGLETLKTGATLNHKDLIVISDGGDNHSRYTKKDVKRFLQEADVQVYCIGILEPPGLRNRSMEEANGPDLLSEFSDISGGRMFSVEGDSNDNLNEKELMDVADNISFDIRNQYVISYRPSNLVRDGKWRRLKVKLKDLPKTLNQQAITPKFRSGYYAPTN
ncbi:MAG: VWA domain-containing protein [Patescibacteria group bacterium]|nr:VWA domain-containing protein [Patescibacteria group bacterium]MDE2015500.1 VWA domain-containing protein [Patescibacteria group bacterium]MDE2226884.1 VWA domain-containing protein [Patescibacteria group bacterium]